MTNNISIPHFYAKIRNQHFYNYDGRDGLTDVIVFGAQSVAGKALTFHIMTDSGGIRSRVPIHALSWKECEMQPLDFLQLWDCFGSDISCTVYDYLSQSRTKVIFKDKTTMWGNYLMTFDWYNNSYSNEPSQYKAAHLIKLDNGNFCLQPNNRLIWKDMSFITKQFPNKPDWKTDSNDWICESVSDRWIIDEDSYYYEYENLDPKKESSN